MTLTELALGTALVGSLAATAGNGIDTLAGDARHAINQQLSASITKTSELQHLLNLHPSGSKSSIELTHRYPAANEAGIVNALMLHLVNYELASNEGYVRFFIPSAPRTGDCEVRYHQATSQSAARIELRSTPNACVHEADTPQAET